MSAFTRALLPGLALAVTGCGLLGRLQVERVASGYEAPSQVAAYLTIEQRGEGVGGLTASQLTVLEDEQDVTAEAKVTLLDRALVAYHHTVLLVDLSKPDPALLEVMNEAARRLAQSRDVTVLGFDGSPEPFVIGAVEKGATGVQLAVPDEARDASRDLNGAVVTTLTRLSSALGGVARPIRRGSLLVITRGTDLAHRVPQDALIRELDRTEHQVFALVAGPDESSFHRELGRNGGARVDEELDIYGAADQLINRMEQKLEGEYLVSYCSPARAGTRLVRIEATVTDDTRDRRGDVEFEIDATGFGPGCDPTRPPTSLGVLQAAPPPNLPEPSPEPGAPPTTPPAPGPAPKLTPKPGTKPPDDGIVPPPNTPDYQSP
ncbi:MAG: hypothetical protein KIT72_09220 [Polyangiaceae bacterium]|nr:hypothetical protein [Polyangiaceae bacterium]MCW5790589.1 hypothetical protein [Polyangiaceae bacterium]